MRHPLYVGSSVMALGVVIATRSPVVAVLATLYMATTITAAVTTEEAQPAARSSATPTTATRAPRGHARRVRSAWSA